MAKILKINRRNLTIKKSFNEPNFIGKSVLVSDPWEYVEMWLRRHKDSDEAIFYWQQARQFYEATLNLPLTSAPLTSYYCFLNATKALLLVRKIEFSDMHGVSGYQKKSKLSLGNEMIIVQSGGILPALCKCLGDTIPSDDSKCIYSLKNLLRNLVYIHRTYCLTYTSEASKELFIPLEDVFFVKKDNSKECWFSAEIDEKYATQHTLNKIDNCFERDVNFDEDFVVRFKKRTTWSGNTTVETAKFINYHKKVRKNVQYIAGSSNRWYIKRTNIEECIPLSPLSITFAAMHRLSELSRYEPITLSKHLNSQQNWLLSEFIKSAPYQFIHEIASEITGEEFLIPRRHLGI
ncbi:MULTISPECIES: YaaC family protein [Bacillus cereus group]|uniref:YaaC family protein n=1 Tax=Bacillus cereus group TaxID=86661 RepID=UPI001596646A|nr:MULTISPECIES: YaaC family protein [Bacillus cereus group]